MSSDLPDTPEHLGIPVDENGNGPADPEDTVRVECWCGDADCTNWRVGIREAIRVWDALNGRKQ